jgi:hypothetical protein
MAKMSRTQLKGLIKECLVEILMDGISGDSSLTESKTTRASKPKRRSSNNPNRRPALDTIQINKKIEGTVSSITSDPILGEILAETARSGITEHNAKSGRVTHASQVQSNGDNAAKQMAGADPTDVFGDSANNWAELAFAGSVK